MRKRKPEAIGKESFHIMAGDVEVKMTGHGPKVALLLAEELAQRTHREVDLIVESRPLFGPTVRLYHVRSDEHGNVVARALENVD